MIHINSDSKNEIKQKLDAMENAVIHKYTQLSKSEFKFLEPLENAYGFSLYSSVSSMLVPKVSVDVEPNANGRLQVKEVQVSSCNIKTISDIQIFTKIMEEVNKAITSFLPKFFEDMYDLQTSNEYRNLKKQYYGK